MANGSWKIARRTNAQFPLAIVAVLAVVVLLLGKAQSGLFDRARAHVGDWMAPVLEVARAPLAGLNRFMGSIGEIFVVYEENQHLKEENARLRQWRNHAIVLEDRVHRYQLMLHAIPDPALSSVMARVIGRANRPFLETMILDAGRSHGVKPGQAVVDARGMIGRIFIAGDHTSWVILLTDLNSRIPVTIAPGNVQAIMTGDNTREPLIDIIAQDSGLKAGDQVVSSGDGSLLPPGLPIGTVTGSEGNFHVALLADSGSSEDVDVLDYKRPPEMPPAPSASDLPATAAGLAPAQPAPPLTPSGAALAPQAAVPGKPGQTLGGPGIPVMLRPGTTSVTSSASTATKAAVAPIPTAARTPPTPASPQNNPATTAARTPPNGGPPTRATLNAPPRRTAIFSASPSSSSPPADNTAGDDNNQ